MPTAPPDGCPHLQYTRYSLGSSFHGLPLTYSAIVCNRPPGHAGPVVPFSDVIYGSCKAVSDYGCPAPLEIQSWPQCHRNYSSYSKGPLDRALNPSALTRIKALPSLPAAMFDEDTRLELYTGDTTVVVFGDDAPRLMTVATFLAPRMVPHIAAAVLGRSARAASLSSASALKAAVDSSTAAHVLRTKALGAPPRCTAG